MTKWRTRTDTVRQGELLVAVLQRAGLSHDDAARALRAARTVDSRKVRPGTMVTTRVHADSGPAEILVRTGIDRLVRLQRDPGASASGEAVWLETEEKLAWHTDTVLIAGVVQTTLSAALQQGGDAFPVGLRNDVAFALADILEYRLDLSRDLHQGDSVQVLVERQRAPNGTVRPGSILAARLTLDGRRVETLRFENGARDGGESRSAYFDGEGKTMRAAFLRAPLAFRRISSVFGLRKHPILGIWRAHQGMDYAAAAGTPVRALGNGTVVFAGWKGGYGRVVEIRHRNGYLTRYGHLQGFASGIKRGASVSISRTIGYVGASGLATAPHLHFEVMVGGKQRDPRVALRNVSGEPLSSGQRSAFASRKATLFAMLDRAVASAAPSRTAGPARGLSRSE
jgi:murein DD-endopeptidase MepM/ murein hydrolase activator NlpD